MNLDPVDFLPGYNNCRCVTSQRGRQESCSSFWINLTAIFFSIIMCAIGIYYYEIVDKEHIELWSKHTFEQQEKKVMEEDPLEQFQKELNMLKGKIDQTDIWRKHLEELYIKISHAQEVAFQKKIDVALDIYDSDKIGLFDYAAKYARGSIHSIPYTNPYPVNRTITFFNLVNINVLSNPEHLLQTNNSPGHCFAFVGNQGAIRIKLGKKIVIRAISLDHIRLYEDISSAPKDFEVYGLTDPDQYDTGQLLGSYSYDINGRPIQTFQIIKNLSFEYVELRILSNYGKTEFTCVYRFRVHNRFINRH